MVVAPSTKVTVPDGEEPVTVAVRLIELLKILGLTLLVSATDEVTGLTICASVDDVLAALLLSPL